ncbi:MAG: radical SAM protein [Candidatus Nealsonbacteria bacterium]
MRANIILINPQIGFSPPLGLLYLAAVLERADHKVEIIEFDSYNNENFDPEKEGLVKKIIDKKPDMVCIACMTAHVKIVRKLILFLKKTKKETPLIIGGPHATALPEDMLNAGADIVILGEGEGTILKVIDCYQGEIKKESIGGIAYRDSGNKIRINAKTNYEDVNKIPFPAYHLINMDRYLARNYSIRGYWLRNGWVFTSRGCPGRCTFCASYLTHGYKVRERNIDDVIEELKFLSEKYKIEGFDILDDTFTVKTERVVEFCGKLRESGLNLKWGCQARVNFFNETQAAALKKAGCLQVDFGVESGSPRVLNYLKKGITVEQSKKAFKICQKYKLRSLATFMIGTPHETMEDVQKTKELLKELKPDYIGIFFTTPYPGTELYKQTLENKWLDLRSDDLSWESNATPKFTMNFTREELHGIYNSLIKDNFKKTIAGYIRQPSFLFDVIKFSILNPSDLFKLLILLGTGKREKLINALREFRIKGKF